MSEKIKRIIAAAKRLAERAKPALMFIGLGFTIIEIAAVFFVFIATFVLMLATKFHYEVVFLFGAGAVIAAVTFYARGANKAIILVTTGAFWIMWIGFASGDLKEGFVAHFAAAFAPAGSIAPALTFIILTFPFEGWFAGYFLSEFLEFYRKRYPTELTHTEKVLRSLAGKPPTNR